MKKDLLSIGDLSLADINSIFKLTEELKKNKNKFAKTLCGKSLALIFQKPSNRTRVSFEVGMYQLGGNSLYLSPRRLTWELEKTIGDVARTIFSIC